MAASPGSRSSKSSNVRRSSSKQRGRSEVLNVSVRTKHAVRLRQRKVTGLAVKALLLCAVAAGLFLGGRKLVTLLLLKNPDYNVAELNVETDGVLTPETVLATAELHKGANIFFVNLDRARARIEAIPEVEKVQVSKQLPNRISIQINERKPVAWVAAEHFTAGRDDVVASPESHLVDARGVLLPAKSAQAQDHFLPIIRNYASGPRSDGREVEGEEIKAALDLLHAQQESVIAARFQVQEIDLSKQFGLEVKDRNGLQVLFDLDDMEGQLKRLDSALQVLDVSPQKPRTINLLVKKNVPVTFVTEPEATATPAPAPPATVGAVVSSAVKVNKSTAKVPASASGKHAEKNPTKSKARERERHSEPKPKRGPQPFHD